MTNALFGRGQQPLSFTLSSGGIPCFGVRGEIRRCDWLEALHYLEIQTDPTKNRGVSSQSRRCVSLHITSQNFARRQYHDSGRPLPPIHLSIASPLSLIGIAQCSSGVHGRVYAQL
jgi:hypothetical protein